MDPSSLQFVFRWFGTDKEHRLFLKTICFNPLDSDWREAPSCFCSVMIVIGIISKYN